jgi:hypothetical protein
VTGHVRPPKALEPGGRKYFGAKTQENVNVAVSRVGKQLQERIRSRIESEEFGAKSKYGHADHHKNTVQRIFVLTPRVETPIQLKGKGTQLKVYLSSPVMPWPLMTNWPIGVPGSRHQGSRMIIRPRQDRKATGKSRKKRLTFFWRNEGKQFWGPKVKWPGFGPDVLSEELKAAQPLLVATSRDAVSRAIVDWTQGGSRNKPSSQTARR